MIQRPGMLRSGLKTGFRRYLSAHGGFESRAQTNVSYDSLGNPILRAGIGRRTDAVHLFRIQ